MCVKTFIDEFNKIGFYRHKQWGNNWPNRTTLTTGLNSRGGIWLRSNYYGSDWIFHTQIIVLIDGVSYKSAIVETYNPEHRTDNTEKHRVRQTRK